MNKQLSDFARRKIKEGLKFCTERELEIFKRMYSPKELDKDINLVVDDMPDNRLDWAMQQVERTLEDRPRS